METKDSIQPTNYLLPPDKLSIASICLTGSNYAQWAKQLKCFFLVERTLIM